MTELIHRVMGTCEHFFLPRYRGLYVCCLHKLPTFHPVTLLLMLLVVLLHTFKLINVVPLHFLLTNAQPVEKLVGQHVAC